MGYATRELSPETWPDFERLFSQGNGWDSCWCMAFQADRAPRSRFRTRAEASVVNHRDKQARVEEGRAHGILVYVDGGPVGWCQFGPADELPASRDLGHPPANMWRITCFVVMRSYRRRGLASLALRAALDAIRRRGGRVVEATPVACWSHGRSGTSSAVEVPGVGPVAPAWGGFGNVSTPGIVSMFEREGFVGVRVLEAPSKRVNATGALGYQVLMRRAMESQTTDASA